MPISAKTLVAEQLLVTVTLQDSVGHAHNLMHEHGYSQLPIVDTDLKPIGIITAETIAQQVKLYGPTFETQPIGNADFDEPLKFHHTKDIFALLDSLNRPSAILLVDDSEKLINIITNRDTALYFRQKAEDLILIGFIEKSLKSHIVSILGGNSPELQEAVDYLSGSYEGNRKRVTQSLNTLKKVIIEVFKVKGHVLVEDDSDLINILDTSLPQAKLITFDDLTLDGFIKIVENNWGQFESIFKSFPQDSWSKMMHNVREIRNKVFHFKEEVTRIERVSLRGCATWYERISISAKS